jgi:hypothetical protein
MAPSIARRQFIDLGREGVEVYPPKGEILPPQPNGLRKPFVTRRPEAKVLCINSSFHPWKGSFGLVEGSRPAWSAKWFAQANPDPLSVFAATRGVSCHLLSSCRAINKGRSHDYSL